MSSEAVALDVAQPDGGCEFYTNIIICRPRGLTGRGIRHCPTCKHRRRFVRRWEMWYGWDEQCTACGDRWQDGERCPRPFVRGWRKEATAKAKERWAQALPSRDLDRSIKAYLAAYFAEDETEGSASE